MPAKSIAQRRYMSMCEKGLLGNCPEMTKKQFHEYAATKEKNLPKKVNTSKKVNK
jgi:hypothetical protein